jgi:hypothetical protein
MTLLKTFLLSTSIISFSALDPFKDTVGIKNNYFRISAETKIAPNFYTTQTGFFCNQERALEKKTKIALKFRLGSLEHTQKLEGYSLAGKMN